MALVQCPECGREISDRAPSCPHCGVPLSEAAARQDAPNNEASGASAGNEEQEARRRAVEKTLSEIKVPSTFSLLGSSCLMVIGIPVGGFILLLLIGWLVFGLGSDSTPTDPVQEQRGWASSACIPYVLDRLRSPSSADFGVGNTTIAGPDVYVVRTYVDADNAFSASIRTWFSCRIRYMGGEVTNDSAWTLESLEFDDAQ